MASAGRVTLDGEAGVPAVDGVAGAVSTGAGAAGDGGAAGWQAASSIAGNSHAMRRLTRDPA
jgi:hypothetical protein